MSTPFGTILKEAVSAIPGAIGGAFAAGDGELVDTWHEWDEDDWAFLTAHFGIIVNHVRSAMHTFHFGDVEWMFLEFLGLDIVIEQLGDKYFVLLASEARMDLDVVADVLHSAAQRIREEML